jgi:VWFA-related protein
MRIACALGFLAIAVAQDRPETVIRTTTRLVQIRVVAEDSKGNPVTNLRKEEFQLQDNRKPQPITLFASEGATLPTPDATPAEARNDYAMILLDWLSPRYPDRLMVRENVNKLLQKFQPRQQVALYALGRPSQLLHDFTDDPAALLQALASTEDPFEPDAGPTSKFDARSGGPNTATKLSVEEQIFDFNLKILDTLTALEKVADALARIPGRKSLIWVSNGFPFVLDGSAIPGAKGVEISYVQDVEKIVDKFDRADVAIYTVDARGLPIGSKGYPASLQEFAARTGGTAFYDRNDLDEGIWLALEDTKVSYTLGFTVGTDAVPGMHEIRLRTTRPGVKLRYRESYQLDAPLLR